MHHEEGLAGVYDRLHSFHEIFWAVCFLFVDSGDQDLELVDSMLAVLFVNEELPVLLVVGRVLAGVFDVPIIGVFVFGDPDDSTVFWASFWNLPDVFWVISDFCGEFPPVVWSG